MIKPIIPQYFIIIIFIIVFFIVFFIFQQSKTTKQTPFRTLDLICFIFVLAILRFVLSFQSFTFTPWEIDPVGKLVTFYKVTCILAVELKRIKFLAPLQGSWEFVSIKFLAPLPGSEEALEAWIKTTNFSQP